MVISDRLKQLIFKQLYKELRNVEIIPYNDSVWFIDREKEYWYFEFEKNGMLWWRYGFFINFFEIFSLCESDFESILSAWVEEVLNHKVSTTQEKGLLRDIRVEEVLNHKVSTTYTLPQSSLHQVEEVLNHKVSTTTTNNVLFFQSVEEVLNHKVSTTYYGHDSRPRRVGEVLNHKVTTINCCDSNSTLRIEEILSQE